MKTDVTGEDEEAGEAVDALAGSPIVPDWLRWWVLWDVVVRRVGLAGGEPTARFIRGEL